MSDLIPINSGNQQSSYTRFQYTLQPGEVKIVTNPYNFFTCLEATAPFDVAWATNRKATGFEKGLYVQFPKDELIPNVVIENTSASSNTIAFGLGVGDFKDNRLIIDSSSSAIISKPQGFATYEATSGSGASSFDYDANTQIDVLCTSGSITLDNAAGITALTLSAGQAWGACLGVAGTMTVTGTGDWNISRGNW